MRRAALLALLCAACGDGGVASQEVALSWAFGPGQLGCEAAGVTSVHVFIGPLAPSGAFDRELRCQTGESEARLRGVAPGRHVLVLKALARDKVLFELQQEIDVAGGELGRFVLDPYTPP